MRAIKDTYMAIGHFPSLSRFKRVMVLPDINLERGNPMTAATQPATPAAPNNNEPVRVNHTARNVIITIVVVAIIAVAAFFGYRAFAGANESSAKAAGNPVKIGVVGATNPEWVKFKQDAEKAGISSTSSTSRTTPPKPGP